MLLSIIINWLVVSTPLKKILVNWDDYSQYMEKNVPNHQPVLEILVHDFGSVTKVVCMI
jgi:hypothetical protein